MDNKKEMVLKRLLTHAVLYHPLPWYIDRDWTYEVRDDDKALVVKCQSEEEAEAVIEMANEKRQGLNEASKQIQSYMETIDPRT